MNTDQPTPPEVTAPAGHEILPQDFLREHGAVEGMMCQPQERPQDGWRPTAYLPGASMARSQADFEGFRYSAPLGTSAAHLTPAPAGYRNVLPGWLAEQETKPEGLLSKWPDETEWRRCLTEWPFSQHMGVKEAAENGIAYAVPLSSPKFHNPDNLAPPGRFLVEGEPVESGDQFSFRVGQDKHLNCTYRTPRRPLSQKGGDEPCATLKQDEPAAPSQSSTSKEPASPAALLVASNAAPTFQPDARPWLPIAEYDREKHGEWIEGRWLAPSLHQGVRKIHWNTHHRRWQDEHEFVYFNGVPTHFRPLPAPSVPTSGTPRTDSEKGYVSIGGTFIKDSSPDVFVPVVPADFARTLEHELASVTAERDGAISIANRWGWAGSTLAQVIVAASDEVDDKQEALTAAQTRADVAERERDEARNRADVLCWNEGKTEGIAKGILKPFEFAPVGATPPHPVLQAAHAVSAVVIERDLALRELAELKAKGEKL